MQESRAVTRYGTASTQASIRGEESEQIELLNIRRAPTKNMRSAARLACAKRCYNRRLLFVSYSSV